MSKWSTLSVGGFDVCSSKWFEDALLVGLFTREDRRVIQPSEDNEERGVWLGYISTARVVRDRLDILGFSSSRVRSLFEQNLTDTRRRLTEALRKSSRANAATSEELDSIKRTLHLLGPYTYDIWLSGVRSLMVKSEGEFTDLESFILESPKWATADFHMGFPMAQTRETEGFPPDVRPVVRAVLDLADEDAAVSFELPSELHEHITSEADWEQDSQEGGADRILVLTEGSSDAKLLSRVLRLLRPHAAAYYSFMDFGSARAPGGASVLVATLKAFIASQMGTRILALFDNDAGAEEALLSLRGVRLPDNVRVMQLPRVERCSAYPTLGPQGLLEMDINGLAGSLELYLPAAALTQPDGTLTPVQWKGYCEGVKKYHGEILHKDDVQRKFGEILAACEADPHEVGRHDWRTTEALLEAVFRAFGKDKNTI